MEEQCQVGFYYTINHIITVIDKSVQGYFNIFNILFTESLATIRTVVDRYFDIFSELFKYSLEYPQVMFLTLIAIAMLGTFYFVLCIFFAGKIQNI